MKIIIKTSVALLILIGASILINCQHQEDIANGEGFIQVDGGKIWYNVVGSGNKTPIVVLHGGPGAPSYYLKPLSKLGTNRKVIFYDQLGCGRSDRAIDTTLMTVDHYVEELKKVVMHFGLKDYYIYGQSWGGMLGTSYYLKYPEGIKAMILSSPGLSIPRYLKDADKLLSFLPDSIQNAVRINEQNKTFDDPAYQRAIEVYYQKYLARKLPWSADLDSTFTNIGDNYLYMWGPSEFTATGTLKNYDVTDRIGEIKVPILFIGGEFDEVPPATIRYYQSLVPGAKSDIIEGAGHLTMQDKPEQNNKVIMDFLDTIEKK